MKRSIFSSVSGVLLLASANAAVVVAPEGPDEKWWGATTFYGSQQPYVTTPWRDLGATHVGPKTLELTDVPLSRLPRFERR